MRATLWQGTTEASEVVREVLRGLFKLAGIEFAVVDTGEELLAAAAQARRSSDRDILVIDCFHGTPEDMDRSATIVTRTQLSVHIVHPREEAVRTLEELAGRHLVWLPSDATIEALLDQLHALRALAGTTAPPATRPLLTPREREVAPLLADGRTNAEIARALHPGRGACRRVRLTEQRPCAWRVAGWMAPWEGTMCAARAPG